MRPLGAALCAVTLGLTGCVSSGPPAGMVPDGPAVTRVEQLSGDYCYFGPDRNVRIYRRGPEAIPFLHVEALAQPTRLSVVADAETIVFSYTGSDGDEKRETFSPAKFGAAWRGNAFEIRWREKTTTAYGTSEGFGVSGSSRTSRLFRLSDGRLIMTDRVKWKSASQTRFLLFESDVQLVAVIFDPDTGGCVAGAADSGRRPWSGRGPDLRDPPCASRLADQLAAILTEEGEDLQVSEALARATVGDLVIGRGDPRSFAVSSPSGTTYGFEVAGSAPSPCELRLYRRAREGSSVAEDSVAYLARRWLPDCVCNP